MKNKIKIVSVVLIGLLLAAGLVLTSCGPNCPGNGECTVTIEQGPYGLYVDNDSPRSSCGKNAEWDPDWEEYDGGCKVQNQMTNITDDRKYGTHGCNC
jgi:hypothetical protein